MRQSFRGLDVLAIISRLDHRSCRICASAASRLTPVRLFGLDSRRIFSLPQHHNNTGTAQPLSTVATRAICTTATQPSTWPDLALFDRAFTQRRSIRSCSPDVRTPSHPSPPYRLTHFTSSYLPAALTRTLPHPPAFEPRNTLAASTPR